MEGKETKKKTLLLVEDDDVVRDMIRGAFERRYHVLEASSHSGAANHLKNHFDLALVDFALPDGDGFDVLKAIRGVKPELPVILMTAYSTENLAIKALKAGVTDYIRKPLSFEYLVGILGDILEGRKKKPYPESVESRDVFIMDSIAAFTEDNYAEQHSLEDISQRTNMNRFKFCRAFKERFGESYTSYRNAIRAKNAADLLQNSDLKITEIAHHVGYGCVTYFERVFKSKYGTPPVEYRREHRSYEP